MKYIDFLIDFETLGNLPDGILVDVAAIPFVNDFENIPTFKELIERGAQFKFDVKSQLKTRIYDKAVADWWAKQSPEAKVNLRPGQNDLSLSDALSQLHDFLIKSGVKKNSSQGWARGPAFDFSHYVTWIRNVTGNRETFKDEAVFFWNQRDVRTAIENNLNVRGMCECPLPAGTLDGFVAHNSIHDCAKDILMLLYSRRYAFGLEDVPSEEDADPRSLKKARE